MASGGSWFEVENNAGGRLAAKDPLMQPEGLWKEGAFEDPIPNLGGKGKAEASGRDAGIPGGNDDTTAMLLEYGVFPTGGKGQQISMVFYFITSWIFFVQGIAGMSGLAVSYFYKDTLKVDPVIYVLVFLLIYVCMCMCILYGYTCHM